MSLINRELQAFEVLRSRLLSISIANGYQNDLNGTVAVTGVDYYDPAESAELITVMPSESDSLSKRDDAGGEHGAVTDREINIEWLYSGTAKTAFATGIPRVSDLKKAVLARRDDRDWVKAGAKVSFVSSHVGQPTLDGKNAIKGKLVAILTINLNIIEKF